MHKQRYEQINEKNKIVPQVQPQPSIQQVPQIQYSKQTSFPQSNY